MKSCPFCGTKIQGSDLITQSQLKAYRKCPSCNKKICVDEATKKRQLIALVLSIIALVITIFLYSYGPKLLILALPVYLIMGLYIYYANKKLKFLPYEKENS